MTTKPHNEPGLNHFIGYVGPGLSGKVTSLFWLWEHIPKDHQKAWSPQDTTAAIPGFLVSEIFLNSDVGTAGSEALRSENTKWIGLATQTTAVVDDHRRDLFQAHTDALIFVVDSRAERLENMVLASRKLATCGKPLFIQYNKRDLPTALPMEVLKREINPGNRYPYGESIAISGTGVLESLRSCYRLLSANP